MSIRDRLHNAQSLLPANSPQPVYQYEYTDMFGNQVFYYSFSSSTPAAWTANGIVFYAFNNQRSGSVPVYQYYAVDAGGRYRFMYSTNLYCAVGTSCGWYNSGISFYAFPNLRSYTKAVYAYVANSPQQRFYYTVNTLAEVGQNWGGWTNGGTAFYTPQLVLSDTYPTLEGYSSTTSVSPGETIKFYISDKTAQGTPVARTFNFYKVSSWGTPPALENDLSMESATVSVDSQDIYSCSIPDGCSWPLTLTKTIPSSGWESGLYYLKLDASRRIYFVVKPNSPAITSNILMVIPFSTWQAYNTWGGTSTYPDPSQNIARSAEASFNRPTIGDPGRHLSFIRSMLSKGYTLEFASDVDLHANPNLLTPYQLALFVGQNEYISKPMRQNLDFYVQNGGNMAVFGGNTSWFQIRLTSDSLGNANRLLICYKTKDQINDTSDPVFTSSDKSTTTFNWYQPILNYPENQTFGLSYRYGTIFGPPSMSVVNAGAFEVKQANHWVYENTGAQDFQLFGLFFQNGVIVPSLTAGGGEGDSLLFKCEGENNSCPVDTNAHSTENKKLYPTGVDGAPINFQILAYMDARLNPNGYSRSGNNPDKNDHTGAVMGLFENNGTVFNGGIYDWHIGLEYENGRNALDLNIGSNIVSKIVWNVINKLSQPKTLLQKATTAIYQYSDLLNGQQSLYYSRLPFLPKNLIRNGQVVYKYDGQAFYAFDRALTDAVPVYQYQAQDPDGLFRFMYSPNQFCPVGTGCLGWTNVGIAFYAYLSQRPGTIPVYAYSVDSPVQKFMYSPNLYCVTGTDCLGWHNNGPAFYVPDSK
ncbi:N,N-dimethylformamidase beta subunit family domain-containing protein [Leptospira stimsonii]|uniref:Uncharacterized protein n=1 Tax=Leptospira stimsonii TaxID=2202203 RepID=A0ABY2N3H8_9LEPT|nr:N,N-dimethylformamidase beta subunit family domain-containing protein [Leptospira stimsonii]TGK22807.1 hypothetical protein EHO98_05880 [Leptospira stimsonii]TGM14979.1 hypothetical protein EHQ90_10925 [Leptospira stimsonii]